MTIILDQPLAATQTIENKDLKLGELRKLIPAESLNPPSAKNFVHFVIKFSLFAVAFYFACKSNSILNTAIWTFLSGAFIFTLGTVGHDCGHGAYIRPRWLNEAIGELCMTLNGLPYAGWKHSHNVHHANTNRGNLDPDRLWLYTDEFLAMNKVGRFFWKLFQTRCFWLSAVGHYFRSMLPWSFTIESRTENKAEIAACRTNIFTFFAILTAVHGGMYFAGFGFKSLIVHFFGIILAFAFLSVYVRTEHFLLDSGWDVHDKPWLTSRTIIQNPILDFFATNLNYHVEHHVLQTIPHANLPALRPLIKKTILSANQPYHEDELWNFLKIAYNSEFFVLERDTFKEIPLSQLKAA